MSLGGGGWCGEVELGDALGVRVVWEGCYDLF